MAYCSLYILEKLSKTVRFRFHILKIVHIVKSRQSASSRAVLADIVIEISIYLFEIQNRGYSVILKILLF